MQKQSVRTKELINNQRGQGMIEYLILVALIAVGTIGVIQVVGQNIGKQYARVNRALGARSNGNISLEGVNQNQLNQKDLGNFIDGARN